FKLLHDAFFKYQTKPPLTIHGDTYFEGKEYEISSKQFKPGRMSTELKEALGIAHPSQPVPWLFKMQEYGPPPSYQRLKIPGVNAPIPIKYGAQYGIQPGQWGQPPIDENGLPLYGDAFGFGDDDEENRTSEKRHWGQMEEWEEKEEEEEQQDEDMNEQDNEDEDEDERDVVDGNVMEKDLQRIGAGGVTVSHAASSGFETSLDPGIDLRKRTTIAAANAQQFTNTINPNANTSALSLYSQVPTANSSFLSVPSTASATAATSSANIQQATLAAEIENEKKRSALIAADLRKQSENFKF
ncbi:MAG: putative Splicing factor 3B subunit 2, partial [Streblomastix strix]